MRKVLKVRHYKAGYEVRTEEIPSGEHRTGSSLPTIMRSAYTPGGDYIGNTVFAKRMVRDRGIRPEKAKASHNVCSIGFCEKDQKWYGWSHRARYGYGVGDVLQEGSCATQSGWTDEYLAEHPEEDLSLPVGFTAKNLADCKRMAIAFAASVS